MRLRSLCGLVQQRKHQWVLGNDLGGLQVCTNSGAARRKLVQDFVERLVGKRLHKEVARAGFNRFNRHGYRAVRGQDDHGHSGFCTANVLKQFQAVHTRHPKIGDYGLNCLFLEFGGRVDSIRRRFDCVPLAAEGRF